MNKRQVSVVILFQAKRSMEAEVKEAMMQLIPLVIAEPQCIGVNLHQDPDDLTKFMLYENWSDKDYYTGEHMRTPHLQAYLKRSEGIFTTWKVSNRKGKLEQLSWHEHLQDLAGRLPCGK